MQRRKFRISIISFQSFLGRVSMLMHARHMVPAVCTSRALQKIYSHVVTRILPASLEWGWQVVVEGDPGSTQTTGLSKEQFSQHLTGIWGPIWHRWSCHQAHRLLWEGSQPQSCQQLPCQHNHTNVNLHTPMPMTNIFPPKNQTMDTERHLISQAPSIYSPNTIKHRHKNMETPYN